MQDEVKVSQADRNAAVRLLEQGGQDWQAKEICLGQGDHFPIVQSLARHRHQAEHETLARMEWRPIDGLVIDGRAIIVGCWVTPQRGDQFWSFWQTYADGGPLGEDGLHGDPATHYLYALPPAPEAGQ